MRYARFILPILVASTAAACARHPQQAYVTDPSTGQSVPVAQQRGALTSTQAYAGRAYAQSQSSQTQPQSSSPSYADQQPASVQPSDDRGFFTSYRAAPAYSDQYAAQTYAQQSYAEQRGIFAGASYQQPYAGSSTVMQYRPPAQASAASAGPAYGYAYAPTETPYTLDSGDKLRVVVFGQEGITGSYLVDSGGQVTLPLVGSVPARGRTTKAVARMIAARLKQGYVRDPHVTVSIETYRPFFILGEVTTPGQYPYVPNMTVENAVAIGGGFSPRARKGPVQVTRNIDGRQVQMEVPLSYQLRPGDTVMVKERWF